METARLNTVTSPKLLVVSVLLILLVACSYNGPIVENAAQGTQSKMNWSGAFIHGSSSDIIGLVHIAEVFYGDGSFWSKGKTDSSGKMDKQEMSITRSLCPSGYVIEIGPLVTPKRHPCGES